MSFPEHCVQAWVDGPWWITSTTKSLKRGALLKAFIPYLGARQELVPSGRSQPTEHGVLDAKLLGNFVLSAKHQAPSLPCAALPHFPKERSAVQRGKIRPALVLGDLAGYRKQQGTASWITKPSVLIAPYFGADADGSRAGWPEVLVDAIERCKLPQYFRDTLPIGGPSKSILRLDQLQPLENLSTAFTYTGFELCQDAVALLDEWVRWYRTGTMDPEGPLYELVQLNIA